MITMQAVEEWRTSHHIQDYEVSNTGNVRNIRTKRAVAVHGSGAKAFVRLTDRKGRQRQKNLWNLVRTLYGHNPIQTPEDGEAAPAPRAQAVPVPEVQQPQVIEEIPTVRWVDIVEDDVRPGYRLSDLGELTSPTGESLRGTVIKSQSGIRLFDRRMAHLARPKDSAFIGYKQVRLDLLVAKYFLEASPGEDYDVEHINGDPEDCRAVNLRWAERTAPPRRNPGGHRIGDRRIKTMARNTKKIAAMSDWAVVVTAGVVPNKYWVSRDGRLIGVHGRPLHTFLYNSGNVGVYVKTGTGTRRRSTTCRLDQLVLEAFGPPRPSPRHDIVHRNGDLTDCTLDNLCWSDTGQPPAPEDKKETPVPTPVNTSEVQVSILAHYRLGDVEVIVNDDEIVSVPGTTLDNAEVLAKILAKIAEDRR